MYPLNVKLQIEEILIDRLKEILQNINCVVTITMSTTIWNSWACRWMYNISSPYKL